MRIGIVTDNYFPSVGGTEISVSNYSEKLTSLGHTVIIFCPSLGNTNPKSESPSIVRLPSIRGIYPDHPILYVNFGITKLFRSYNLDVIHSQTPISAPYIAEYVSRRLRIPHIHTLHTLVPEQVRRWRGGLSRAFLLYLYQSFVLGSFRIPKNYLLQDENRTLALKVRLSWIYLLRLAQIPEALIVPSRHVREILVARGHSQPIIQLPTFSSVTIPQKLLNDRQKSKRKLVRIIYVGRLDIEKRPQVLIDAVHLLPEDLKWHLTIIGVGSEQRKLKRLVKKYGLNSKVDFKGKQRQQMIANELVRSDIFVLPSYRFDTQAIVLLEACSAGLPIVYCDNNLSIGVERKNSILTKPFALSLSQGIARLIKDEKLRHKLALGSQEVNKKYTPDKLTKRLVRIYKQTIDNYHTQQLS